MSIFKFTCVPKKRVPQIQRMFYALQNTKVEIIEKFEKVDLIKGVNIKNARTDKRKEII